MSQSQPSRKSTKIAWRRYGLISVLVLVLSGWGVWHGWASPAARAGRWLASARTAMSERDYPAATSRALKALEIDPALSEAAWLAAEATAATGESQRAVELARQVPAEPASFKIRAALLAADLNLNSLKNLEGAETDYRTAVETIPDHPEANSGLAHLLGMCGRRQEAIPYVIQRIKTGNVDDQLVLLAREQSVVHDRETLEEAHRRYPQDANALMGLAWLEADAGRVETSLRLLRSYPEQSPYSRRVKQMIGEQLLQQNRPAELAEWLRSQPDDQGPVGMLVRAKLAEHIGNPRGAMRCYWEALKLRPENRPAWMRLQRLLSDAGETAKAQVIGKYLQDLQALQAAQDQALFSNQEVTPQTLEKLIRCYLAVGRKWEAYGWCQIAEQQDSGTGAVFQRLHAELEKSLFNLPSELVSQSGNPAYQMDLTHWSIPALVDRVTVDQPADIKGSTHFAFINQAAELGLQFRYLNGTRGAPARRMYEFTGGGIGVIDFDADGYPDVFLTQGTVWPPGSEEPAPSDSLFANQLGERFRDVAAAARLVEARFGQGVAVGDYDNDGFADLYVANIRGNRLWHNNGDGTFSDVTDSAGIQTDTWTTSCVMADLNGDGWPDLFDVNYVMGPDVFDRVCSHQDGTPKICMPFDFDAEPDRLWLNDGAGGFRDATSEVFDDVPQGKGLGAAVWSRQNDGRLSLFVANDTTPDYLFEATLAGQTQGQPAVQTPVDRPTRLGDRALELGLAFNREGKATASMGVALGDVNDDGRIDVHITNFSSESNSLFVQDGAGAYEEVSQSWGVTEASLPLLGFGTQFLDADLNGEPELFVSNGHIDDWRSQGYAYEMPAQLFERRDRRFVAVDPQTLGDYFQAKWLGRAVARIDWNRDGREDLLVGHLHADTALLTNTTRQSGRGIALRLVGVKQTRDAIGAVVSARVGDQTWVKQVTAGDGYQASNDRRIVIGVGAVGQIDLLHVRWPGGHEQSFADVSTGTELLLIEGRSPVRMGQLRGPDASSSGNPASE